MSFMALSKYQKLKHKRLRNDCFGPKWMCSQNTIKNKEEIALLYVSLGTYICIKFCHNICICVKLLTPSQKAEFI